MGINFILLVLSGLRVKSDGRLMVKFGKSKRNGAPVKLLFLLRSIKSLIYFLMWLWVVDLLALLLGKHISLFKWRSIGFVFINISSFLEIGIVLIVFTWPIFSGELLNVDEVFCEIVCREAVIFCGNTNVLKSGRSSKYPICYCG